jgi:hypothetical protein
MKKRQIITIILALILGAVTAQADIIQGRVVDADTGEPLQGANGPRLHGLPLRASQITNLQSLL